MATSTIYTLIIPEYNNNIIGSYMHFLLQTQNISHMKRIIITFPHSIAFTPELHFLTHSSRENIRESGEKRLTKINISLMVRFCVIVISFSPQITTYYSYHSHSWKGLLTPYMYECVYVMLLMNVSFFQPQILQQFFPLLLFSNRRTDLTISFAPDGVKTKKYI